MSGVIIKGKLPQVQLPAYTFDPKLPVVTVQREVGTRAYIISRAQALRAAGFRVDVSQEGDSPAWRLEARVEGDPNDPNAQIENTHELRVNVLYPDVRTNRVLQRQFGSDAAPDIAEVQMLAGKIQTGEYTYETALASISTDIVSANQAVAVRLLDLLLLGTDTFVQFQDVYVHTFNFGTLRDLTLDRSNVGKIFTSGALRAAENIPDSLSLDDGYWIKMKPEKVVSIGQGEVLKYEYWWAEEWTDLLYDAAT